MSVTATETLQDRNVHNSLEADTDHSTAYDENVLGSDLHEHDLGTSRRRMTCSSHTKSALTKKASLDKTQPSTILPKMEIVSPRTQVPGEPRTIADQTRIDETMRISAEIMPRISGLACNRCEFNAAIPERGHQNILFSSTLIFGIRNAFFYRFQRFILNISNTRGRYSQPQQESAFFRLEIELSSALYTDGSPTAVLEQRLRGILTFGFGNRRNTFYFATASIRNWDVSDTSGYSLTNTENNSCQWEIYLETRRLSSSAYYSSHNSNRWWKETMPTVNIRRRRALMGNDFTTLPSGSKTVCERGNTKVFDTKPHSVQEQSTRHGDSCEKHHIGKSTVQNRTKTCNISRSRSLVKLNELPVIQKPRLPKSSFSSTSFGKGTERIVNGKVPRGQRVTGTEYGKALGISNITEKLLSSFLCVPQVEAFCGNLHDHSTLVNDNEMCKAGDAHLDFHESTDIIREAHEGRHTKEHQPTHRCTRKETSAQRTSHSFQSVQSDRSLNLLTLGSNPSSFKERLHRSNDVTEVKEVTDCLETQRSKHDLPEPLWNTNATGTTVPFNSLIYCREENERPELFEKSITETLPASVELWKTCIRDAHCGMSCSSEESDHGFLGVSNMKQLLSHPQSRTKRFSRIRRIFRTFRKSLKRFRSFCCCCKP